VEEREACASHNINPFVYNYQEYFNRFYRQGARLIALVLQHIPACAAMQKDQL
jgi:hypothetical protein